MDLDLIRALAKKDRYVEALNQCQALLSNPTIDEIDVLRVRAYVYARSGDYENALVDRNSVIESGNALIQDYYLFADNALSAGKFEQAAIWFREVIRIGEIEHETWFASGSHFLLAYTEMMLGKFDNAYVNADKAEALEADCSMPTPDGGMYSVSQLRELISDRERKFRR